MLDGDILVFVDQMVIGGVTYKAGTRLRKIGSEMQASGSSASSGIIGHGIIG